MAPQKKNNGRRGGKRENTGRRGNGDDASKTNDGRTQRATEDPVGASIYDVPGSLVVVADQGNYSAFEASANQISAKTGASAVVAVMAPNDPRAYQRALRRFPHIQETKGQLAFGQITDVKPRGIRSVEVHGPLDDEPAKVCMACGRYGHEIKNCVYPGHDGLVHGCMVCNKADHNTDSCVDFAGWPLQDQLDMLVQQRGNMPSMATELDWIESTRELLQNPFVHKFQSFPWTRDFGRTIAADNAAMFRLRDYYIHGCRVEYLPKDPATKDLKSFMNTANARAAARLQRGTPGSSAQGPAPAPAPAPASSEPQSVGDGFDTMECGDEFDGLDCGDVC